MSKRKGVPIEAAVTVRVWIDAAGRAMGEVFAPSRVLPALRVRAAAGIGAEDAAILAIRIAALHGLELVVSDDDGLWDGYMDRLEGLSDAMLERVMAA